MAVAGAPARCGSRPPQRQCPRSGPSPRPSPPPSARAPAPMAPAARHAGTTRPGGSSGHWREAQWDRAQGAGDCPRSALLASGGASSLGLVPVRAHPRQPAFCFFGCERGGPRTGAPSPGCSATARIRLPGPAPLRGLFAGRRGTGHGAPGGRRSGSFHCSAQEGALAGLEPAMFCFSPLSSNHCATSAVEVVGSLVLVLRRAVCVFPSKGATLPCDGPRSDGRCRWGALENA